MSGNWTELDTAGRTRRLPVGGSAERTGAAGAGKPAAPAGEASH